MTELIYFIMTFTILYLFYLILVVLRKKGLEKFKTSTEINILKNKYKLNIEKINMKKIANLIALANSFLIATTVLLVGVVENFVIKIIVSCSIMIPLILVLYHFIGIHFKKQEIKKERNKNV
jgi:hypothetical protein